MTEKEACGTDFDDRTEKEKEREFGKEKGSTREKERERNIAWVSVWEWMRAWVQV